MKKFQFRLEPILVLKKNHEELVRRDFELAMQKLQEVLGVLEHLKQEKNQQVKELSQAKKKVKDIQDLLFYTEYIKYLTVKMRHQEDLVMRENNVCEEKRKVLQAAVKERKIYENLKKKKFEEWEREIQHLERKLLDEQTTVRYVRKEKGLDT